MNDLGREAEQWIAARLTAKGVPLLATRFQCRQGEIDLIFPHQQAIVFCEVKFRRNLDQAPDSITWQKRRRIRACAEFWLCRNPLYQDKLLRFDAAFVTKQRTQWRCQWVKHAFDWDD